MGCFLACFGFKAKKKRRKPGKKSPSGEQDHQSYVPLHSDASIKLDIKENMAPDSYQLKEKPKEPAIAKIKKKVSFNLNVKAYEPIPDDDDEDDVGMYLSEGEEETKWEFNTETENMANLHFEEENAMASSIWSYPASHRYQNCGDSYAEEDDDELKLEENQEIEDIDDEEVDDVYSDRDNDDGMPSREDFPWELNLVAVKSDNEVIKNQIPEAKDTCLEQLPDLQTKELQGLQSKSKARDRSQYVFSVLNPVENQSQWKVVKAKAATPSLKCQKENLMSQQDGHNLSVAKPYSECPASMKTRNPNFSQLARPTIAVDVSLSNWLSSSEVKTTTKYSSSGQDPTKT